MDIETLNKVGDEISKEFVSDRHNNSCSGYGDGLDQALKIVNRLIYLELEREKHTGITTTEKEIK